MKVSDAILSRHSMRVFHDKPVPKEVLHRLLDVSRYAASNGNVQPWKVYVAMGEARKRLSAAIMKAIDTNEDAGPAEYDVYPRVFDTVHDQRRKKVGKDLYTLLNVPRGDAAGMAKQFRKNFEFFGAPAGMILTIDRGMGNGQWIDSGIFLGTLMLLAREEGLHTCPQAAFARFQKIVRRELAIPDNEVVLCGLAVGYADAAEVPNNLVTDRASVEEFSTFIES